MGQKVSPHGPKSGRNQRLGFKMVCRQSKTFADMLVEDNKIRSFVKKKALCSRRFERLSSKEPQRTR